MLAGFVATWLVPSHGWRSLFYFGGAIPFIIGLLMIPAMPESLQFWPCEKEIPKAPRMAQAHHPSLGTSAQTEYVANEEAAREGVPVAHFPRRTRRRNRAAVGGELLNLLNLYFLTQWMTTVLRKLRLFAQTIAHCK